MPYKDKEKQRAAQRQYDEKRKGTRHRGWVWVSYPESIAEDWREKLTNEGVPVFISPSHDRDLNGDGTPKKPHHHGLMLWDSPTSYEVAKPIADTIGAVMPPKNPAPGSPKPYAMNVRTAARYLCHLDNPDKAQYDPQEVTCINCTLADYFEIINSAGDDDLVLDEITDYIDNAGVTSFAAFIRYCKSERPEWKRLAYHKYAALITRYIKSCEWEQKQELERREQRLAAWEEETAQWLSEHAELAAGNWAANAVLGAVSQLEGRGLA